MQRGYTTGDLAAQLRAGAGDDGASESVGRYLSVRAVCDRLGLAKPDTVLTWIKTGELLAANVSGGTGRPTWRIDPADLQRFLAGRRAVVAPAPSARRRKARSALQVTTYF